jgi:hypothetical protein
MDRDEEAGLVIVEADLLGLPHLAAIEALCRASLLARRRGVRLVIRDPSPELRALLELCGLAEALSCREGSALEAPREAEQREQAFGVEEEGDPGEPVP